MRAIRIYEYRLGERLENKRIIALGLFDGVHVGHREIIKRAANEAKRLSLPCAVFTFKRDKKLKGGVRIYSDSDRIKLIGECGADEVILASFEELSSLSAEDFVKDILIGELGCAVAVSGADFRFGRGARGDVAELSALMGAAGLSVITVEDVLFAGVKVSSSDIKNLLLSGDVKGAARLLGKPYFVTENIRHGMGLGKEFGFPTVNTDIGEDAIELPHGVYATEIEIDGRVYPSLTNVGKCPTVGERVAHRETFILDFDREIYGERVKISFIDRIRAEKKFSSVEELKMQIKLDINTAFGERWEK